MTKREKIIDAAITLFGELGFQGTSTTKITKLAGVGTGTLFLYFESKDELVNMIYVEIKNEMKDYYSIFEDLELSFHDQLNLFWRQMVIWGLNNPEKFHFTMQYKNSSYITQQTTDEVGDTMKNVHAVMMKAVRDKIIINQPFEFLMTIFSSQFNSIIQYMNTYKPANKENLIQASFEVLWNGIKR